MASMSIERKGADRLGNSPRLRMSSICHTQSTLLRQLHRDLASQTRVKISKYQKHSSPLSCLERPGIEAE